MLKGELEVYLPQHGDAERMSKISLNRLSPGDIIGEYSLIDSNPASASVCAFTEAVALKITKMSFEDLVKTSNRIGKFIYKNLLMMTIQRLREKDRELDMFNRK